MKHRTLVCAGLATLALTTSLAVAGDGKVAKEPVPGEPDSWQFKLSAPGWIPWLEGDAGVNGVISHIALGPDTLVPKVDMVTNLRGEARKGRWSVIGEFFYMSLSDGIGTNTVVKKIDVQVDQTMGDLAVAWRLVDSPRGYLDLVGGARYTNLYQKVVLQPNDTRIDEASSQLAAAGRLLRVRLAQELAALAGKDPTLPIAPLGGGETARLAQAIAKLKGSAAERQKKIARLLHDALDRTASRTDDWFDPYIGLRGRYNFNDQWYFTAKADIGGFTVGADLTWTAEAALGRQLTDRIYSEIGYRALGVDYEHNGLTYNMITHGPQATLGITF